MQLIQHRVNTIEQLKTVPTQYGVELDIRDKYDELIIEHDAFNKGTNWKDYLKAYQHQFFIANIKTEGIEETVMQDLENAGIMHYFLLDVSLPFMVKLIHKGFSKMAIRFSEYEPLEFVQKFAGKVEWVWVDCFTKIPLDIESYPYLKKHFKICLVSPELQQHDVSVIKKFREENPAIRLDAVCTKHPDLWL